MYLGCLRTGKKWKSYANVIVESWAQFTGWYFVKAEYNKFGYAIPRKISYSNGLTQIYCQVPYWLNVQNMTQATFQSESIYKDYTPIFIDLHDEMNQRDFYKWNPTYTDNPEQDIYPDDDIVINNPILIELLMIQSQDLESLKSNLMKNKNTLHISEADINKYFSFYEI